MSNAERRESQHNSPQRIASHLLFERARTPTSTDPGDGDVDMEDDSETLKPESLTVLSTEHQKALMYVLLLRAHQMIRAKNKK